MSRYDRQSKPGLVALYDIRPGNGAGPFLQPRSPHGAGKLLVAEQRMQLQANQNGLGFQRICFFCHNVARNFPDTHILTDVSNRSMYKNTAAM